MPALTADQLITLLTDYTRDTGHSVDLLLVGALALHAYGFPHRVTHDIDAELAGPLEPLHTFFPHGTFPPI